MSFYKSIKMLGFSLLLLAPFSAQAALVNLVAVLSPAAASPATGSAALVLDTSAGTLGYLVNFGSLTGPATAAHFHAAPVGLAGPVVFDLAGGLVSGIGASSGLFAGAMTGLTAPAISSILADGWYINIHTAANPAGELRGQIVHGSFVPAPVPLPASVWLMASALGAFGFLARRRQAG